MKSLNSNLFKKLFVLSIDLCIVVIAIMVSLYVIFDFLYHPRYQLEILIILFVYLIFFRVFHTNLLVVKFLGEQDYINTVFANIASLSCLLIIQTVSDEFFLRYKILILVSLLTLYGMVLFRWFMKTFHPYFRKYKSKKVTTAIFGAGKMGHLVLDLSLRQRESMKVVAFFDDDPSLQNRLSNNVRIYNPEKDFERVLIQKEVDQVIFAVENLPENRKKFFVDKCLDLQLNVLTVPSYKKWINGKLSPNQLQNIRFEELLNRDEIFLDRKKIAHWLSGKIVLVTGAAGSIGSEISRQLTNFNPKLLIMLDAAESPLVELDLELNEKFNFQNKLTIIGNINDENKILRIFKEFSPDVVYHAAAYKHVPILEDFPYEALNTNVLGTHILAKLACNHNVDKFILISTDKAVNPSSIMGSSKRVAELLVQSLDHSCKSTHFMITRFGNVLGSTGSVVPRFNRQINEGGPVTVTHPDMERYFMTIPEACQLVLEASVMGNGGEVFLFDMGEPIKIRDLALHMIKLSGNKPGEDIEIVYTGLRPGEKLKEELIKNSEDNEATYHPKIKIVKEPTLDFDCIAEQIDVLERNIGILSNEDLIRQICSLVPEFNSTNENIKLIEEIGFTDSDEGKKEHQQDQFKNIHANIK